MTIPPNITPLFYPSGRLPLSLKRTLGILLTLFLFSFGFSTAQAVGSCGGAGERACCVGETTFGACKSPNIEKTGNVPSPALCGGFNPFGSKSNSRCEAPAAPVAISSCGGIGDRACCTGEATFGACKSSAIEIMGKAPAPALCGGVNPFGIESNSWCDEKPAEPIISSCGGAGERACCIDESTFGACSTGNIEKAGAPPEPALCGGKNPLGFKSNSHCEAAPVISSCGGIGERACCLFESTFGACTAGNVEVAGNAPAPALCGGTNPFGVKSNGHCAACGTSGAPKCVGAGYTVSNECGDGLTADFFSICSACGGEGQPFCKADIEDMMCNRGYHPDGGLCKADRVIAEPDCNCTPEPPSNDPSLPVRGYADLHLHMFSNLGFGGLTLWGDAFDKKGGVSQALRADNYAQQTADYVLNGHVRQGVSKEKVPIDAFRGQQLVHGDLHINDLIGGGTGQHSAPLGFGLLSLPNSGVEWNADSTANNFEGWPKWSSTTHQQSYYKWLERAHRGGLQLTVMIAVTNESMCVSGRSLDYPEFGCETSKLAIDMQIDKAYELEDWLNFKCQRSFGPGLSAAKRKEFNSACATPDSTEGWFKVVKSPQDAREAIAKGQLAVILGIEEANLFNCNEGTCTDEYVQGQIDEYFEKGVRHIFPIHNFDNDYGGAATWMDTIAVGNTYATKAWYETEECPNTATVIGNDDGYGFKLEPSITDWLAGSVLTTGWSLPDYWPTLKTSCNQIGLKPLGRNMIQYMMNKGMIIDIDHMSVKAVNATLTSAEANSYPGIVASHTLLFDLTQKEFRHERMRTFDQLKRIAELGGMIAAMTQPPEGGEPAIGAGRPMSIQEWPESKVNNDCQASSKTWAQAYEWAVKEIQIPVAFGTDFNGISRHNAPRFGDDACDKQVAASTQSEATRVTYPFTIEGFGEFDIQETGGRLFDYNENGLAHVGLLPDMIQDLKNVGLSDEDLEPLFQSAEAYIVMWEGAETAAERITRPAALPRTSAASSDNTAPTLSVIIKPLANDNGWHKTSVTITVNASDEVNGSGVDSLLYRINSTEEFSKLNSSAGSFLIGGFFSSIKEGVTTFDYSASDLSLNIAEFQTVLIRIDRTKPAIVATITPDANAAGWHNQDVTLSFDCADGLSDIASCTPERLLSEGGNQQVTGSAIDNADNSASVSVTVNVDTTQPVVTITGIENNQYFLSSETLPAISCNTVDTLSGVKTAATLSVFADAANTGINKFTISCDGASDIAGNTSKTSVTYYVADFLVRFTAKTDVPLSANIISASVKVEGLSAPVSIAITGGSYSINGGEFLTAASTLSNGDTVRVRHVSADEVNMTVETVLTVGSISGVFNSTTVSASGASIVIDPETSTPKESAGEEGEIVVEDNADNKSASENNGSNKASSDSKKEGGFASVHWPFLILMMTLLSLVRIRRTR